MKPHSRILRMPFHNCLLVFSKTAYKTGVETEHHLYVVNGRNIMKYMIKLCKWTVNNNIVSTSFHNRGNTLDVTYDYQVEVADIVINMAFLDSGTPGSGQHHFDLVVGINHRLFSIPPAYAFTLILYMRA